MNVEEFVDGLVDEQAKIDAGVRAYIDSMPKPGTLEQALLEREFWITEACRFSRNEDYYRGLVDRVAEALGPDAFTADDGSRYDEPVRAKVPELVEARLCDSGRHAQRGDPSGAPSEGCQSGGATSAASPTPNHPSNREAT